MGTAEILTTLLLVICLLAVLAERVRISPPIVFLLGGTALAFLPGIQTFTIEPQAILTIFLPPLLMELAYFTSVREFRRNLHPIMQLAVGLVIATAFAVAATFRMMVPGAGWAAALVLGAIVSPPDAVAATSIIRRMRVPKRIVSILEGESLINDATGLILYKFAVAAVMTAQFSLAEAGGQFVWMVVCGTTLGWGIARIFLMLFRHIRELSIEILSTFVLAYVAYISAETLHGSGVLAVVTAGITVSWFAPSTFSPRFRIPSEAVWKMTAFVLNALVFILIGLRLPILYTHLSVYDPKTLITDALIVCLVAGAVRFVYVFVTAYGFRWVLTLFGKTVNYPAWQNVFLIAFTGIRGVVSLATTLALPVAISWGVDFPYRDLITFLALSLIVFTLVLQGLALPWIIRKMTLTYDSKLLYEDWHARATAAGQALARIETIEKEGKTQGSALARIKSHYRERLAQLGDGPNTPLYPGEIPSFNTHPLVKAENNLWQEVLKVEHDTLIGLRKNYAIGDDVLHEITREIDLLSNRFAHAD
jgi:CPA1 family monovalent cation:H+ antiporter